MKALPRHAEENPEGGEAQDGIGPWVFLLRGECSWQRIDAQSKALEVQGCHRRWKACFSVGGGPRNIMRAWAGESSHCYALGKTHEEPTSDVAAGRHEIGVIPVAGASRSASLQGQ